VRFNIIFFVIGLILLLTAALFDVNYVNYRKPIPFSQWQTITFYDFTGLKRPGKTLAGLSEFAYIKTSREIHYFKNGDTRITANFHPSRSYVFSQHIRNPDLLKHELYHFHITEYFTRLLRKEISAYNGKATRNIIADLNKKYCLLETEMQKQYDDDTYHSYVLQEQKKWEATLDNKLFSLSEFSNPVLSFKK
jgi:hypothetical protein